MKTLILSGGLGTRLAEYTDSIPKPMVKIGSYPIIHHIMNIYSHSGFRDFYLALGYKAEVVKEYFLFYRALNTDYTVSLKDNKIDYHNISVPDWQITMVDTGLKTMTGGRIKRMQSYIGNQTFMLTYGDGVADLNINELLSFHKKHGKMITLTAVHPTARYGELMLEDNKVTSFKEKPEEKKSWINGGFFVIEPEIFDLISDDDTVLEEEPLEQAAILGQLMAYKHHGFWQCMDTLRDLRSLEKLWQENKAPWSFSIK